MYHNGFNWWLTKHGRARFIERFGMVPDAVILAIAIHGAPGYKFIWAPDKTYPLTGRRLVTVLIDESQCTTLPSTRVAREAEYTVVEPLQIEGATL